MAAGGGGGGGGGQEEECHLYPFAGAPNASVRLGVVPRSGGPVVWMDVRCGEDPKGANEYLARVCWEPPREAGGPSRGLLVQLQDRSQQRLQLVRFDPTTGRGSALLEERSPTWVNLHHCLRPLEAPEAAGRFLWASERSGYCHLYLHAASGALEAQVTGGEWMVESLEAVDEPRGLVYFTGTCDGALEAHLYSAPLRPPSGAGPPCMRPRRLTTAGGRHSVVVDPRLRHFIDIHDSLRAAPSVTLRSLSDGALLRTLYRPQTEDPRVERLALEPPEVLSVPGAPAGTTGALGSPPQLYCAVYAPDPALHGPGPYKTLVSVYGGPHVQCVCNSWLLTVDMRAQFFRSQGYLVLKVDNRGTARRGTAFEGAIRGRLGAIEVADQAAAVRFVAQQGLVDVGRVGIYGWSYGGYLAAMAMALEPRLFRCSVIGAPVTFWDGYDTHYTERYLGTPQSNPEGYRASSVLERAAALRGPLLLVHGMIDENVHFSHTTRLISHLHAARKTEYNLLAFPNERHIPRKLQDRSYLEKRIADFFEQHV